MVAEPLRRPLRDALTGGDDRAAPVVITATCTSTSSSPPRVVLQLADGTLTGPLPYPAWWVPRAGDVVIALLQDGVVHIVSVVAPALTAVAPHRHQSSDIDGTIIAEPSAPPPPPPPPPAAPSRRTVNVQPTDMGSWGYPGGSVAEYEMRQSGQTHDAFWFYGDRIAAAKGSGTIVGGSIYVERLNTAHGVNGAANVRLATHAYQARPAAQGGLDNVVVVGTLERGRGRTFPLSGPHIAALNSGARNGLGLAHGNPSYTSPDYLRATTGGASGALSLTIES